MVSREKSDNKLKTLNLIRNGARKESLLSFYVYHIGFFVLFFVFFSEFCMCELASFDAAARGKAELHLEVCPLSLRWWRGWGCWLSPESSTGK